MNNTLQDLRYALRSLAQKPMFALIAVLSVAIGVGANASIFSIVNAMLLRAPAGVGQPERVVEVGRTSQGQGFDTFSYPEIRAMTTDAKTLDRVAATRNAPLSFTTGDGTGVRISGLAVGQPYFEAVGTTPFRGRFFAPEEDAIPGRKYVAVVSHAFWQQRLGGRADVVGSTIELNRRTFTITGVTRPEFAGHMPLLPADVYIPMMMFGVAEPGFDAFDSMQSSWVQAIGRLAPGATVDGANAEMALIFSRLRAQYPEVYGDRERSARVAALTGVPAAGHGPITAFLSLLMGLVALVLLTTCANVAGMMIARAAGREREIAIRLAIGSGRGRLIRQLLIESVVLFAAGGILGIIISTWGMRAIAGLTLPVPVTLNLDFSPDATVFAFGLIVTLVTGIVFGLAPALQ
jgi:putative ABC transport system permease protein